MTKHTFHRAFSLTFASILSIALLAPSSADATEDLRWSGDLRYRFVQLQESTDDSRLYQQLRARLGVRAKVQDDLEAVFRLATATSAISNNQTLGDSASPGMARRSFGIDSAYGEWKFRDDAKLVLGRAPSPFFAPARTQVVFDHDLAFEGMSVNYAPKIDRSSAFATLGAFIVSENYTTPRDAVDTGLVGLDLGYNFSAGGTWTVHAARYHFFNVTDQPITRFESGAALDSKSSPFERYRGNSVHSTNRMAYGFTQTEAGIEWKMKDEALELTGYFDWITNELAGDKGDAFEAGINTKYGRLQVLLAYAMKKSDSVIGAFTDSDFNGGGTDNRGTKIILAYQLSDRTNVALSDFRGTRGMDSTRRDYNSQHLDFSLQF